MNVVGEPIVHRDSYVHLIEDEINAYFREVIFAPLFGILEAHDVPIDPRWQAIKHDELGRENAAGTWRDFPNSLQSLGLARADMPQIPQTARGAVFAYLEGLGITHRSGSCPARDLRPTQAGYFVEAVEKAKTFLGDQQSILVSADGYVIDGHHRWFAAYLENVAVDVIEISARARSLLRILREMPVVDRANAGETALLEALRTGRVQYAAGVFAGKFSARISLELRQLGATFDKETKTFRLAESKIPLSLRGALADAAMKTREISDEILRTLGAMTENIGTAALGLSFGKQVDLIVGDLQKQLVRTVSGLEGISVAPDITPEIRKALDEKLTNNLDLAIKDFTREEIPELRRLVEENVFAGGRSDRLADIIESRWGVTKRKANFLADQETGLLTAQFREERYAEIGVDEYVWSDSGDLRVRPDHHALNGRRFSFRSPPVVDRATGRRRNPGQDYRCRCVARPVFSVRAVA